MTYNQEFELVIDMPLEYLLPAIEGGSRQTTYGSLISFNKFELNSFL